jgi:hypothetical protein
MGNSNDRECAQRYKVVTVVNDNVSLVDHKLILKKASEPTTFNNFYKRFNLHAKKLEHRDRALFNYRIGNPDYSLSTNSVLFKANLNSVLFKANLLIHRNRIFVCSEDSCNAPSIYKLDEVLNFFSKEPEFEKVNCDDPYQIPISTRTNAMYIGSLVQLDNKCLRLEKRNFCQMSICENCYNNDSQQCIVFDENYHFDYYELRELVLKTYRENPHN